MNRRVANLLVQALRHTGVTPSRWALSIGRAAKARRLVERLAMACGVCRCGVPHCQPTYALPTWAPSVGGVLDGVGRGLGYVIDRATPRVCTVCHAARPAALCVGWSYTFEATGAGLAELASVCPNCALASNVGRAPMGSA